MIVNEQITETSDADDQFLAEKAFAVRVLVRNMENNAFIRMVAIGRHLRDVRAELSRRGGAHKGMWLQWLERELGWTDQTARNVINLSNVFGSSDPKRVWDWNLPLRTLYMLAAPSTPEAVRVEILTRAETGERLRHQEIKTIIAAHASKSEDRNPVLAKEAMENVPEVGNVGASASPGAESLSHPARRPTPELSTTQPPEREHPQVPQEPQVYAPATQPPPPQIQSAPLPEQVPRASRKNSSLRQVVDIETIMKEISPLIHKLENSTEPLDQKFLAWELRRLTERWTKHAVIVHSSEVE
jgi:hypothetical protein